jgi:hypothetical protein
MGGPGFVTELSDMARLLEINGIVVIVDWVSRRAAKNALHQ